MFKSIFSVSGLHYVCKLTECKCNKIILENDKCYLINFYKMCWQHWENDSQYLSVLSVPVAQWLRIVLAAQRLWVQFPGNTY